jgi:sigma-B regulation protein RsbU (phosphoserine phosphatase)
MFVTLFYALIDSTRSQITYVNAGQNPPLMLHRSSSGQPQISRLGRTGMALGIQKDNTYDQYTLKFFPGDFLVMYTDGVTDLVNSNHEEFGMDRLLKVVNDTSRGTAEDMARSIEMALDKFSGGTVYTDDITLVIAKRR